MKKKRRKGQGHPQSKKSPRTQPSQRSSRSQTPKPADPPPIIPGEFEFQEALVFGCGHLVRYYPQLFVDFVRVTHERIKLIGIIAPEWRDLADLLLGAAGLPMDAVKFVEATTTSVWARDWSPFMGYDSTGRRCQLYVDRSHMRHRDDIAARKVFQELFPNDPIREVPILMEGGNLLSNGQGLVLSSNTVNHANRAQYEHNQIAEILKNLLGGEVWASVPQLHAEHTGHIDLFTTFLRPDFLVVASVEPSDNKTNHQSLNNIASKLDGIPTKSGKLQVARVPMGSSKDTYFRSYNNVIFANKTLLVSNFPQSNAKLDRRVIDIYREYLPGWDVIGINLGDLHRKHGGLHCLSVNIPPPQRILKAQLQSSSAA